MIDTRRHEIDSLRVFATLLLIVFHTAMVFNPETVFHIQNGDRSFFLAEVVAFIHQWHMPLFFALAGMAAWYSLQRRSAGEFSLERVKRLFVPLVFGMLVIIPPQVYVERISGFVATRQSPIDFEGSLFDWYPNTFQCCYPDANLSWHHLWFLLYLFVYSLLLVRVFKWLIGPGETTRLRWTGVLSRGWSLVLLPGAYLFAVEAATRGSFPNNQDLVTDLANHLNYPVVLLLGFLLVSDPRLEETVARIWGRALLLGLAVIALPDIAQPVDDGIRGLAEWSIIVGLVGLGRRRLAKPVRWVQRFSGLSLPFYIWHQTVIVVLAYFVIQWDAGVAVKYFAIALPAFLITWGLSEAVAFTNPSRAAFGLRPRSKRERYSSPSVQP